MENDNDNSLIDSNLQNENSKPENIINSEAELPNEIIAETDLEKIPNKIDEKTDLKEEISNKTNAIFGSETAESIKTDTAIKKVAEEKDNNNNNNSNSFTLETVLTDNKNNYIYRIILCAVYAICFTFCLYKNPRGVTYPVFTGLTIASYLVFLKAIKTKVKPFSIILMTLIMALGINVFTTTSVPLIVFDCIFVFARCFVLFLNNLYNDKTWDATRYFVAAISVIGSSIFFLLDPILDLVRISGNSKSEANVEKNKKPATILYVFVGLMISVPLLCIILPLLITSDAVFSNVLYNMTHFKVNEDLSGIVFLTVLIFLVGYALVKRLAGKIEFLKTPVSDKRVVNPAIAITISAVLLVFYALYSGIQIIYLFLGFGTLPDGYTYADYAHEGFFQLVFVCLINLILVLVCRKFSKDNTALKVMLTLICICTYVMLFSSGYRMILYISVYGLTFLRVYVLWALTVIALVMAGTVALIYKDKVPFVKYSLVVLVGTWAIFAFSHPDSYIAEYNLSRGTGEVYVVSKLSNDAVPAIIRYEEELRNRSDTDGYMQGIYNRCYNLQNEKDIRKFNLSDYYALEAYRKSIYVTVRE